jgi:hypothetical protein
MHKIMSKTTVIVSLCLFFVIGSPAAHASNGAAAIAGTWEISGNPEPTCGVGPFINLASISKDGVLINVDPVVGTGVGEVQRLGGKEFAVGFFGFLNSGMAILRYEVKGRLTLIDASQAAGTFTATITDPLGAPICVYGGTLAATRLVPDLF